MKTKFSIENPMPPIWIMYPHIPQYSIGWRMGYGEGYLYDLQDWLETLSKEEQQEYNILFPKPIFWREFDYEDENSEDGYINEYNVDFWQKYGKPKFSVHDLQKKKKLKFIFFWKPEKDVIGSNCFSQWQYSKFSVGVDTYYYAEQYMMAEKARIFEDEEIRVEILESRDPKQIKALGRKVRNFNQEVWNQLKYSIVLNGNYYKFTQNEDMRNYLLSTGDKILVEASPLDKIWGVGYGEKNEKIENPQLWRGENLLGFALMEVREELKRLYQHYNKINWDSI